MKLSYPTLYIFNNVLFPDTVISLSIKDDTSKNLLFDSYNEDGPIIFYYPGEKARPIATLGKVLSIEENGAELSVLIMGIKRVRLIKQEQKKPLSFYQAELYDDFHELVTPFHSQVTRLKNILSHWALTHIDDSKEVHLFLKQNNTPERIIHSLCVYFLKDLELKELFLESRSLCDKINLMNSLLKGNEPIGEDEFVSYGIKIFAELAGPPLTSKAS